MSRTTTTRPVRRGLVIGAGAALGGAWALGVLAVLQELEGYDARDTDVVVGTSAGSVLGALLASGVPLDRVVERLAGPPGELAGTRPVNPLDLPDLVGQASAFPVPLLLPGNLALAARALGRPGRYTAMTTAAALAPRGRGDLLPIGRLVDELCPDGWPAHPRAWLVAMDFGTGRRVVLGRAGAPPAALPAAVMASCAAPGWFPPVLIDGRRHVDGGAVSVTNADVLAGEGLDEVLVVAPMTWSGADPRGGAAARLEGRLRRYATRRLDREVGRLAVAGSSVRVFTPTAADLVAMGPNVMDPGRRRLVFETARRTTAARLDRGEVA